MDAKQWAKELPAEVREVLDAGVSVSAPNGAKQAIWRELMTTLPVATAGTAAGGLTVFSIIKPLVVGLVVGAAATVGVLEFRSKTVPAVAPSTSKTNSTSTPVRGRAGQPAPNLSNAPMLPMPLASQRPSEIAPTTIHPELPLPSTARDVPRDNGTAVSGTSSNAAFPDQAPAAPHEDLTVLESRRLNQARATLRAGDAQRALAQLDSLSVEFPRGVLVQELDALRIEALLELGERQSARELARRFLAQYPQSPHALAVERALH